MFCQPAGGHSAMFTAVASCDHEEKNGIGEGDEVPNMGIYFGEMIEK